VHGPNDLVCAAICIPPDQPRDKFFEFIRNYISVGFPPPGYKNAEDRLGAYKKVLEDGADKFAKGRHWYVLALGVMPAEQGKGYGKQMLKLLSDFADEDKVEMLLECTGERAIKFFKENADFKKIDVEEVKDPESAEVFKEAGGVTFMSRASIFERKVLSKTSDAPAPPKKFDLAKQSSNAAKFIPPESK